MGGLVVITAGIALFAPHIAGADLARLAGIAAATLVSEDATCIATGFLVRRGGVGALGGVVACWGGIALGDLGLFGIARLAGPRLLRLSWLARRAPLARLQSFGRWFDRNLPAAVVASRFLPGTRLPLYLAAGLTGGDPGRFALWTLIAGALWTPPLVLGVALFGDAFLAPFERIAGGGWVSLIAASIAVLILLRAVRAIAAARGRARLTASILRLWRWEFWPSWLFYLPAVPWIAWLSLRHRGFTTITAANPGIPHGGFVGESKHDILSRLPEAWTLPAFLVDAAPAPRDDRRVAMRAASASRSRGPRHPETDPLRADPRSARLETLLSGMAAKGLSFPIVLKPDVGERGAGVRLVHGPDKAAVVLATHPGPLLAQAYHPGPFEAGIFYYRLPGDAHGRIFSITDKEFPEIVGDGASTLEDLVWRHPRRRMQARTFLARHAGERDRVPARNERVHLGFAGNHSQGAMFLDGSHLITEQLTRTIDAIARGFDSGPVASPAARAADGPGMPLRQPRHSGGTNTGFFFGRFDVRYSDPVAFREGRDLAIVELNGITSESTNLYDPSLSLLRAYRILFRQWAILFEIGARNRARGARVTPLRELLVSVLVHRRLRAATPALSD